jgi:hypothetical protein
MFRRPDGHGAIAKPFVAGSLRGVGPPWRIFGSAAGLRDSVVGAEDEELCDS